MEMPVLGIAPQQAIKNRSLDAFDADKAAVQAIAQAAVEVELFTIPLYMTTMYSIFGTHQINSKWLSYYKGRQWPGMGTGVQADTPNQKAFNVIFSVFIQEMLHLQMAANLATAIRHQPCFTGPGLQDASHGWTCYSADKTLIPHIVDLKDTNSYAHVRVNLEELNANQCDLFLAIEQPEQKAREELAAYARTHPDKYFPAVPFAGWTKDKTAADLPLFGTIGYMYECYAQYISIEYEDGQTLWAKLYDDASVQQDMFNTTGAGHPKAEFPRFATSFSPEERDGGGNASFNKAIDMMAAITDQGEGNAAALKRFHRGGLLTAVQPDYREDKCALEADYPSYATDGGRASSADAAARFDSAAFDHYERFAEVKEMLGKVQTWAHWHRSGENRWTGGMLINSQYDPAEAPDNIPTPDDVAGALNRLKDDGARTLDTLSKVAGGALYGITSVLDSYWQVQSTQFPYPSMVGAGDRFSICWAVLGCSPALSQGVPLPVPNTLYHACQGLSLNGDPEGSAAAGCAALAIYHTCRGSNGCHAQGGCGFAQLDSGGGSCGHSVKAAPLASGAANLCGGPKPSAPTSSLYSAPADNKCKTFGGCAVPISASQLFPAAGKMAMYDFGTEPPHGAMPLLGDPLSFQLGDNVYDTAWEAYGKVMAARGKDPGEKPAPTDLRLALPPST
jgi:hypothetical protein